MKKEDAIIQILQEQFVLRIDDAYGSNSVDDFIYCVGLLRILYQNVALSRYETITAFVGTHPCLNGKGREMRKENIHDVDTNNLIVKLVDEDNVVLYQPEEIDVIALSNTTFIYHWKSDDTYPDKFYVKGDLFPFSDAATPEEGSFFAVRTYSDLEEALINYRDNVALMCKGRALSESMTSTRLFFNPAPEALLQEALNDYLTSRLRNCDVKREHNVDDSHPVDIIVHWRETNHLAIIEIKWIGKSLNKDRNIGVSYYDARANEGASQLIGYIDDNGDSHPRDITVGYLVVYDLRRHKNDDVNRKKMSRADADWYRSKEVNYNPQYDLVRKNFRKPYRFFIKVSNDVYED